MKFTPTYLVALPVAFGFTTPQNLSTATKPISFKEPHKNNNNKLLLASNQQRLQTNSNFKRGGNNKKHALLMAIPTINDWTITNKGEATGVINNHPDPSIANGEYVTTSVLSTQKDRCTAGATVVTSSGSKYKLGSQKGGNGNGGAANGKSSPWGSFGKSKSPKVVPEANTSPSFGYFGRKAAPAPAPAQRSFSRNSLFGSKAATLDDWTVTGRGEVKGTVKNHPDRNIQNGEVLTTSSIVEDRKSLKEGQTVATASGSKYILGKKKGGVGSWFGGGGGGNRSPSAASQGGTYLSSGSNPVASPNSRASAPAPAPAQNTSSSSSSSNTNSNKSSFDPFGTFKIVMSEGSKTIAKSGSFALQNSNNSASLSKNSNAEVKQEAQRISNLRDMKIKYGVNGKTVGNGLYLLCGKPQRSTSGKSNIWSAYRSDSNGMPMGDKLTIKVSSNYDAIEREADNYNRVCSGLFPGRFVDKSAFLPNTDGQPVNEFKNTCALVIESGRKDLKAILAERNMRGFEGKAMRDAATAALQCVQAMHSSGIVWTDLKTENFVIVSEEIGDNGFLPGVKGIDLESAMPRKANPVDFSPEACPPEFASAFIAGEGLSFTLSYSYDIWSYGMMLYELHTGKSYFGSKTPAQITKSLQYGTFNADTSLVTDSKLRDLIDKCLQSDPKRRPNVTQLLLHPYFLSTGFGPFSF